LSKIDEKTGKNRTVCQKSYHLVVLRMSNLFRPFVPHYIHPEVLLQVLLCIARLTSGHCWLCWISP
jgi:hypothetical protein